MKNQYQFMINVGRKFEPALKELSKKVAGTPYADLARWGIQVLNRTTGETPFWAYASRLGDRSMADVLSQLWKLWVTGEIKLPDDLDQPPDDHRLTLGGKATISGLLRLDFSQSLLKSLFGDELQVYLALRSRLNKP